jgi:hypothetical protein
LRSARGVMMSCACVSCVVCARACTCLRVRMCELCVCCCGGCDWHAGSRCRQSVCGSVCLCVRACAYVCSVYAVAAIGTPGRDVVGGVGVVCVPYVACVCARTCVPVRMCELCVCGGGVCNRHAGLQHIHDAFYPYCCCASVVCVGVCVCLCLSVCVCLCMRACV